MLLVLLEVWDALLERAPDELIVAQQHLKRQMSYRNHLHAAGLCRSSSAAPQNATHHVQTITSCDAAGIATPGTASGGLRTACIVLAEHEGAIATSPERARSAAAHDALERGKFTACYQSEGGNSYRTASWGFAEASTFAGNRLNGVSCRPDEFIPPFERTGLVVDF